MTTKISGFKDDFRFLSNFYYYPFFDNDGTRWGTVEHAYQYSKTNIPEEQKWFIKEVGRYFRPGQAKQAGKQLTLRSDWDNVKRDIMKNWVRLKFAEIELARRLLATSGAELIEENYWGDTYWGVCNGVGENYLGKILMEVREEIELELYNSVMDSMNNADRTRRKIRL